LAQLLSQHPRYAGRSLAVVNDSGDALGDALSIVINSHLATTPGIELVTTSGVTEVSFSPASIDQLDCLSAEGGELQLLISVAQPGRNSSVVSLKLRESGQDTAEPNRLWQWTGALSKGERDYAATPGAPRPADGSLTAPWEDTDVEIAAQSLSRDFACSLRPSVAERIALRWPEQSGLPALVRDTVNGSRHFLGGMRELYIAEQDVDYRVEAEIKAFRNDTWQLWLTGSPVVPLAEPVQAVAYFRAGNLQQAPLRPPVNRPLPAGTASDFLGVEMLGATQSDRGRSGADLAIALRLVNRGEWPIVYSLRVSGGHFNHCIARPGYYRHDRYGKLSGKLAPGSSQVQRLVVEGLEHRPYPWFGMPKCAGSTDLQALENYAVDGYRVTDYVRWDM
jgi:hypothetical protein